MTHDPNRDARLPGETNHQATRPMNRERGGMGMGLTIGLIALALIGGFFFFSMRGDNNVATDTTPRVNQPATTGSGASGMTTPASPTPSATPTPSPTTPSPTPAPSKQ